MAGDNEAVVRRYFEELCNDRNAAVADEIIAPNYVAHGHKHRLPRVPRA